MADEPSWEDIFKADPEDRETAPLPAPFGHQLSGSPDPAPRPPVSEAVADDPFSRLFTPPSAARPNTTPPNTTTPNTTPASAPHAAVGEPDAVERVPAPAPVSPPVIPATPPRLVEPAPAPIAAGPPTLEHELFAELFPSAPAAPPQPTASTSDPIGQPMTRREAREAQERREAATAQTSLAATLSGTGSGSRGDDGGGRGGRPTAPGGKPRKKRRLLWLKITLPIVLVLGALGGVATYGWLNYETQIRALLGIPLPTDYEGTGNGEEVVVTVRSGDIGSDVATTLHKAGVTMTYAATYDYLVAHPDVSFLPGNFRLQKQMSAASAVAALQDPANKVTDRLLLREGISLATALEVIAETTGIPLADVQAAAANPQSFGLPAQAPTLEGYLFPATYDLDGSETAQQILQKLVDTMNEHLDAAGVPAEKRYDTLIMASIIQREAGSNTDDFYKISRVFQNRIDQGMNLESDATVAYGTGRFDSVWTNDSERADASNPYNTYANPGLPVGPIGLPGDLAIDAALHPVDGPWLFFVPINLATGETVFSETFEEHEAAVEQLQAWCAASPENDTYCE